MEALEGTSDLSLTQITLSSLEREPLSLHIDQIVQRVGYIRAREKNRCLLSLGHVVGSEHVLCALCVDESVLEIQFAGLVQGSHGSNVVSCMLEDTSLGHVQLDQCRGVLNRPVDVSQCLLRLALEVKVLCQKVQCPQKCCWGLYNRA